MSIPSEPGALPPSGFVPLCVPEIRGNEWAYIKDCLDTNWVSSVGAYVDRFEQRVAEYVGVNHAIAVVNGTSALHIALLVAGVQPGDEVLVPALTFIAPVNAICYAGAYPVLMDVEPDYWQLDPQKTVDFLKQECEGRDGGLYNRATGRRVRAILPVHILGHPVDLEPMLAIARQYDLAVIEDAAESIGARYRGQRVGQFGDLACLSFNGNKIITTGGGGMLLTNDQALARKAKYLTTQAKDDPIEYIHHEIGYNYRLPNLLAAMGVAQMEQLDDYIAAKRQIAATYQTHLARMAGITPMPEAEWAWSTFWLYTVLIDSQVTGVDRVQMMQRLQQQGIQTRPLWQPLHQSPAHADCQAYRVEVCDRLYQSALSLPCSVGLGLDMVERVVKVMQSICSGTGG